MCSKILLVFLYTLIWSNDAMFHWGVEPMFEPTKSPTSSLTHRPTHSLTPDLCCPPLESVLLDGKIISPHSLILLRLLNKRNETNKTVRSIPADPIEQLIKDHTTVQLRDLPGLLQRQFSEWGDNVM